jgi:hypothetical protein
MRRTDTLQVIVILFLTIRIISKPNLYLMKIRDDSSVESVMECLRKFKEVKHAEPNYIRTIH